MPWIATHVPMPAAGPAFHAYVRVAVNLFLVLLWALTSNGFTVMPWEPS